MTSTAFAPERPREAQWLWPHGHAWTVDFHGHARREFALDGPAREATLRISAYADYTVWLNGTLVGRGPGPCEARHPTYDSYDVAAHLRAGVNAIAVLVHNYGLGVHWQHRGRGGLIAQIDIDSPSGAVVVATDGAWRVRRADAYAPNSPRTFWSADFAETFDFRRDDPAWLEAGSDDSAWEGPEVVGPLGTRPWTHLTARDIPLLREQWEPAAAAGVGRFTPAPLHTISFTPLLAPGRRGLARARAEFLMDADTPVRLHIECDDAFRLFLNGTLTLEQNYSEHFARTRVWRGRDEYDQVHDGMGDCGYTVDVTLRAGANRLTVVVDQGPWGWGFVLACLDPVTGRPRDLPLAWTLSGPWDSTGLSDSLDAVTDDAAGAEDGGVAHAPEPDVTDYATLMAYEARGDARPVPPEALTLRAGEFRVLDLGRVTVGYPTLTFDSTDDATVDVGYGQVLADDRRIDFSNGGRMKYVDRVRLRPGRQTWQPARRRAGRYIHLSCRRGDAVTVTGAGTHAAAYPVEDVGAFDCSDQQLNDIWRVSVYTTRLLMQQGWQDCLKREQGTLNTSSFNYASRGAACAFGDLRLARKNIAQAFGTQNETGWLAVWLKDYHLYSGDTDFVREVFDSLEDNLRFFHKGINRHGLIEGRNRPLAWQGQGIYLDDSYLYGPYVGLFGGELFGFNALYCAALEAASTLAAALGEDDRAEHHARRAARVRRGIRARFWDEGRHLYRDWRDGDLLATTHHPILQITALHFGLGDDALTEALMHYLCEDLGLPGQDRPDYPLFTFGYYFYFLEALFRHGQERAAYDLLRRFYGRWLDLGATTFGEFFQPALWHGRERLTEEYEVHAYGTSAHLHFYTHILGVQPLEAGFGRVRIAPKPGDLAWARGTVATPRGQIGVSWRWQEGVFLLNITLPPGCGMEVGWPSAPGRLTINNREEAV